MEKERRKKKAKEDGDARNEFVSSAPGASSATLDSGERHGEAVSVPSSRWGWAQLVLPELATKS